MAEKTVIAFDLYGTLLSTESIAEHLDGLFGAGIAKTVAAQWRRYQLEYTWRINSMGMYRPFGAITRAALRHAVAEASTADGQPLRLTLQDEESLMASYNGLATFSDVSAALDLVRSAGVGSAPVEAYIFSNGTDEMVEASLRTAPELAAAGGLFPPERIITVEEAGVFKPDGRTYTHLQRKTGMESRPENVWVVTANPFDALGARAAGVNSAWVDRAGKGWIDALGSLIDVEPTITARTVDEAVRDILSRRR